MPRVTRPEEATGAAETWTLGLFFTRGVSLRQWVESGLFDREVLIYHHHLQSGFFTKMVWFTYGADDAAMAAELSASGRLSPAIEVIACPRWISRAGRAASALYSLVLPLTAWRAARRCQVFKTNQMEGSIPAVICAALWRRPLYVRTGFTLSRVVEKTAPGNPLRRAVAFLTEYLAFRRASAASVSSRFDRDYVVERYRAGGFRLEVIGNYVDTALFSPSSHGGSGGDRVLFVGRLSPEKNLDNAIRACAAAGLGLDIVGAGAELELLKQIAGESGADVRWLGVVPNKALPELFCAYRYFMLPSLWEGLPKALIEAMAAGLVCIGNNTTGINEIIEDGVTGFLSAAADAATLAETLRRARQADHRAIARAGRDFICRTYSLEAIAAREQALFTAILAGR
jgi:glycosyltransferase involved in cell wall biosynthesis